MTNQSVETRPVTSPQTSDAYDKDSDQRQMQYMRAFVESIPEIFEHAGEILWTSATASRRLSPPDGTPINSETLSRTVVYQSSDLFLWLRKAKGLRAYTYPAILHSHGIETPDAIATHRGTQPRTIGLQLSRDHAMPLEHELYDLGRAAEGTLRGDDRRFGSNDRPYARVGHHAPRLFTGQRAMDEEGRRLSFLVARHQPECIFGPVSMRQGCATSPDCGHRAKPSSSWLTNMPAPADSTRRNVSVWSSNTAQPSGSDTAETSCELSIGIIKGGDNFT